MRFSTRLACLPILFASQLAFAATPPAVPTPMRDFFRNPEKSGFQVSPGGTSLSYVAPYQNRRNVFVQPRAGGAPLRVTEETERDIAGYFWKGDDRIVYVKDFKGDENFHIVSVGKDGKGLRDLTPFPGVRAEIVDLLEDHPTDMLVSLNKRKPEIFDVYRLNTATGDLKVVAENPGNVTGWRTDHAGNVRVATTTDGVNTSLLYRATESAPWKTVLTTNFKESVAPLFFTFDDKMLYVASNRGRDKSAIAILDPSTGKETKLLFEHPEVDVESLDYSHKRKVITYAGYETWHEEKHFFDAQTEALYKKLEAKLSGYEIQRFSSHNKAEDVFVVAASNDRTQGTRYLYEANSDKLTKLADITPWLDEKKMSEMKPITVHRLRDGLTLHGYLTLPAGKPAKQPAARAQPARRSVVPRRVGLQPRGAVPRQPRLRSSADELSRLDGLRPQVLGGVVQAVGQEDERRSRRLREVRRRSGHRRSEARRHLRRLVRRLCDARRARVLTRPVCLRHRLRRRLEPVHVHEDHPALLEAAARQDPRDDRRSREGQGAAHRDLARCSTPTTSARRS